MTDNREQEGSSMPADVFPVGVFWPPPPFEISLDRYREVAGAGFTFLICGDYGWADSQIQEYALGIADQTGLAFLTSDPVSRWLVNDFDITSAGGSLTVTPAEASVKFQQVLEAFSPHRSFSGIALFDEPSTAKFTTLANAVASIGQLAPSALPYINLLPNYATPGQLGAVSYPDYLQQFIEQVKPRVLSFDYYYGLAGEAPLFSNWSDMRAAALGSGLPAWAYIQSINFGTEPQPVASDLLWQINVALAYGCKGIQYFTYWTPDPARGFVGESGLLAVDGTRTPLYQAAVQVNTGYLAPVGRVLLPLVSDSVQAANLPSPPAGLPTFAADGYVSTTSGAPAVLGRYRAADPSDPTRWLLVANYSRTRAASVQVGFGASVKAAQVFDPGRGGWTPAPAGGVTISLGAGAAELLRLEG